MYVCTIHLKFFFFFLIQFSLFEEHCGTVSNYYGKIKQLQFVGKKSKEIGTVSKE